MPDDLSLPAFGNPALGRQGDKGRANLAKTYEDTWLDSFIKGIFGSEEPAGSVLEPDRAQKVSANDVGQKIGIAANLFDPPKLAIGKLAGVVGAGGLIGRATGKGGLSMMQNFAKASDMHEAGADARQILAETGLAGVPTAKNDWTLGHQIYDGDVKVDPDVLASISGNGNRTSVELSRLLQHPELYDMYPQLKRIPVSRLGGMELMRGAKGSFSRNGEMKVAPLSTAEIGGDLEDVLPGKTSTLLHEIQHGIQAIEGWPRGGNMAEFALPSTQKATIISKNLKESLKKELQQEIAGGGNLAFTPDFLLTEALKKAAGQPMMALSDKGLSQVEAIANHPSFGAWVKRRDDLKTLEGILKGRHKEEFNKYSNLAGEAQSRAVQRLYDTGASPIVPINEGYDRSWEKLDYRAPFGINLR